MKKTTDILSDVISEMEERISESTKKGDHHLDESSIRICRQDAQEILGYLNDLKTIRKQTPQP